MPSELRNVPATEVPEPTPSAPQDMPHGLIQPPAIVRQWVAAEKAKFGDYLFNAEQEERSLNDLTLQFYFESFNYEVLYRSTPIGPEVLAVGFDEVHALTQHLPLEVGGRLKMWMS